MVRDAGAIGGRGLRGSDFKVAIDGNGVAADDFAVERLGKVDGE